MRSPSRSTSRRRASSVRVGPLVDGGASDDGLKRVLGTLVSSAWPLDREGREWVELELQRPSVKAEAG